MRQVPASKKPSMLANQKAQQSPLAQMPFDVLRNVFANLDRESLKKASLVSRRWHDCFADMQYQHSKNYWLPADTMTLTSMDDETTFVEITRQGQYIPNVDPNRNMIYRTVSVGPESSLHQHVIYVKPVRLSLSLKKNTLARFLNEVPRWWLRRITELEMRFVEGDTWKELISLMTSLTSIQLRVYPQDRNVPREFSLTELLTPLAAGCCKIELSAPSWTVTIDDSSIDQLMAKRRLVEWPFKTSALAINANCNVQVSFDKLVEFFEKIAVGDGNWDAWRDSQLKQCILALNNLDYEAKQLFRKAIQHAESRAVGPPVDDVKSHRQFFNVNGTVFGFKIGRKWQPRNAVDEPFVVCFCRAAAGVEQRHVIGELEAFAAERTRQAYYVF